MLTSLLATPEASAAVQVLADHDRWHGPGFFFWPIVPIFWVAVIVVLLVVLRRRAWRRGDWHHRSGISVLEERFASGEIDESEYRARLAVLLENRRR